MERERRMRVQKKEGRGGLLRDQRITRHQEKEETQGKRRDTGRRTETRLEKPKYLHRLNRLGEGFDLESLRQNRPRTFPWLSTREPNSDNAKRRAEDPGGDAGELSEVALIANIPKAQEY